MTLWLQKTVPAEGVSAGTVDNFLGLVSNTSTRQLLEPLVATGDGRLKPLV